MTSEKADSLFRPFEGLAGMLSEASLAGKKDKAPSPARPKAPVAPVDPEYEARLFMEAMADVKPIRRENCLEHENTVRVQGRPLGNSDGHALDQLSALVQYGRGFVVSQTPEYMEGMGYGATPELARRLHQGGFSIQGHVDLHGFTEVEARHAFDIFLKEAIASGKRAVLIVHGRGLCSPANPVLKERVYQWLTTGLWRKWVIAFTSARACDGGTGATYVLLRLRPLSKKFLKKKKRR